MSIKISVIIPCYNVETLVRKCIKSVIDQTYQPHEVICINDGSQDDTLEVLQSYNAKFGHKVSVLNQSNSGASKARNRGLKEASGDYIQFLDADDFLYENKLEHQVQLIKKENISPDLIAAAVEKRFEDGRIKIDKHLFYEPWEALARYHIGLTSSNLWKKKALEKVGGFDEHLSSNQEHDLIFRMLKNGAKVLHDPKPLTIKIQRTTGSISSKTNHYHLGRKVVHRFKIYEYAKEKGLLDNEILDYLLMENISNLKKIYRADSEMALQLHHQCIPEEFRISEEFSNSYRYLYNFFGFKMTEKIRRYLGK